MNKHVLAIMHFTALLLLVSGTALGQKFGEISDDEWHGGPPVRFQEANAAVLFDKGTLEVTTEGISLHRHVRIIVYNQAGADEAADVEIHCWDDDKMKDFKAHTITPDGKKHKVKKKSIHTKKFGLRRTKVFAFPTVEPGSILEYKYRIFHKRYTYLDPWYFQNDIYTFHSELNLELAPGFVYSKVANNLGSGGEPTGKLDEKTNVTTYTWILKDLFPLRNEVYSGARRTFASSLHYQLVKYEDQWQKIDFVQSWRDLGTHFTESVIAPYLRVSGPVGEALDSLRSEYQTETDLLKGIYHHVANSIKLTEDPTSGYSIHMHLDQLQQEAYGTGNEKNMLLVELCRQAGMKAWPVLICSRDQGIFNPEIYQLQQFDDMIVYVKNSEGGIFLDAGSAYCPFGVLPANHQVNGGFMLDDDSSQVVRVISSPPRTYRLDRTSITVNDGGTAQCSTTVIMSGYFGISYGMDYELTEEDDFFKDNFLDYLDTDYTLVSSSFEEDEGNNRCTVTLVWSSSELAEILDNNLILKQPTFYIGSSPFTADRRFYPIDFRYPFTYHSMVTIDPGEGFDLSLLPEKVKVSENGIDFIRQAKTNQFTVTVEAKLDVSKPLFKPLEYRMIKGVFGEIEKAFAEEIVLSSTQ